MNKKILIIEDEEVVLDNITFFLEAEGFKVYSCMDGVNGLKMAQNIQPDAILCDLMLPKLDGYEILQTLRKDKRFSITPFIFLSARAEKTNMRRGMELGADDYITKPFTFDELYKALNSHLKKNKKLDD
jgi:DNA-binding response OmpR family regulator